MKTILITSDPEAESQTESLELQIDDFLTHHTKKTEILKVFFSTCFDHSTNKVVYSALIFYQTFIKRGSMDD